MSKVGTREEWLAARTALLAEEKELTRRSDEVARKRQALPWVAVSPASVPGLTEPGGSPSMEMRS